MKLSELSEMIGGVQTDGVTTGGVCPIDGISQDGAIFFKSIATPEQKAAAQALMDQYLSTITED